MPGPKPGGMAPPPGGLGGGLPPPPPMPGGGLGGLGGGGLGGPPGADQGQQPPQTKFVKVSDVWEEMRKASKDMEKYKELTVHWRSESKSLKQKPKKRQHKSLES